MNEEMTKKIAKKEKQKAKRRLKREQKIKKFTRDFTNEDALYRFMKKFSCSKQQAIEILAKYGVVVKKEQKEFATKKCNTIKLAQKEKRKRKQLKKQKMLKQEAYDMYKDEVVHHFLETGEINTIEEFDIFKEEFF